MALHPSRRDTVGPPPRDVSDLASVVRHQGSYLRSLDPGILGGRFATPRPPAKGAPPIVGGDSGGDGTTYEWQWDDRYTVTATGTQTVTLTYAPVEESLFVRWHPDGRASVGDLTNEHFTVDGQTVTIADSGIFAIGDEFSFQYQFDPGTSEELTITARGYTADYTTDPNPLPAGTKPGDTILVIVMNQRGWQSTMTDDRLSLVASSPAYHWGGTSAEIWMGTATHLGDIDVTSPATWPRAAVITFDQYMVADGSSVVDSGTPVSLTIPVLPKTAALLVLTQNNDTVTGIAPSTTATGWVPVVAAAGTGYQMWGIFAYVGDSPTPSGTTYSGSGTGDGGNGSAAFTVGVRQ